MRGFLEAVVRRFLRDRDVTLTDAWMFRHAPAAMLHGAFFVGTRAGAFFYFEEPEQGLMVLSQHGVSAYLRLSAFEVPPDAMVHANPRGPTDELN